MFVVGLEKTVILLSLIRVARPSILRCGHVRIVLKHFLQEMRHLGWPALMLCYEFGQSIQEHLRKLVETTHPLEVPWTLRFAKIILDDTAALAAGLADNDVSKPNIVARFRSGNASSNSHHEANSDPWKGREQGRRGGRSGCRAVNACWKRCHDHVVVSHAAPCVVFGVCGWLSEIMRRIVFLIEHCSCRCELQWESGDPTHGVLVAAFRDAGRSHFSWLPGCRRSLQ